MCIYNVPISGRECTPRATTGLTAQLQEALHTADDVLPLITHSSCCDCRGGSDWQIDSSNSSQPSRVFVTFYPLLTYIHVKLFVF